MCIGLIQTNAFDLCYERAPLLGDVNTADEKINTFKNVKVRASGGLEVAGEYVWGGLQSSSLQETESWPQALLLAAKKKKKFKRCGKKVVVWGWWEKRLF